MAYTKTTETLWLSNPTNPSSHLQTYRFKSVSVLLGASSWSFFLNAAVLKHLELTKTISNLMVRDLCMDNILTRVQSLADGEKYFRESRQIMADAGFNFRIGHQT